MTQLLNELVITTTLFPFVGSVWGIVYFALNFEENLFSGVAIVITTILFLIVAGYFSKVLLGYACKNCTNFSCSMNKVPKEIIEKFLEKNPKMKEAWLVCGWDIGSD